MQQEAQHSNNPSGIRRVAITVWGVVQGVGFRPFVYNAARAESLAGWVLNESDCVQIEVEGPASAVASFLDTLQNSPPRQAQIDRIQIEDLPPSEDVATSNDFEIRHSQKAAMPGPTIPADLATCEACYDEIMDPAQRRYCYPFTNCTNCGPRWSIIQQLPYDRPRTSMESFEMCAACRTEYEDPTDRRFHAQPIACPDCGPQLRLLNPSGDLLGQRDEAMTESIHAILAGKILAVKGLGGFQLIVDAKDSDAVAGLRQRKQRPDKPFAVMMRDLLQVRKYCVVSEAEAEALMSPSAPVLLLRRLTESKAESGLAAAVAPGNPYLGVMLPYTPLHHLLMAGADRPVVCTSGNLSEEPMAIETAGAVQRLRKIADLILTHDRPIVRPVDDSVARIDAWHGRETGHNGHGRETGQSGLQLMRRSRGYAPRPIRLNAPSPTILAVGGHLKNTVALSLGSNVVMSPHIGDLDNTLGVEVFRDAIDDLVGFFAVTPEAVACDLHPDYASTRHAEQLAERWQVPLVRVQHHHAHVAACIAENALDGPVLGFSWDGTGYGSDGTVWGGEVLLCEGGEFQRVAHLRTFQLPGGDIAARQPRRSMLGMLYEALGEAAADHVGESFSPGELRPLMTALSRGKLFPRTSSMGRLFDGMAALCGKPDQVSFEGQAAMDLEFVADPNVQDAYDLPLSGDSPAIADWEPMLRAVLDELRQGVPKSRIAARFHNGLAELAVTVACRLECRQVALTGGCFQNALLVQCVRQRLLDSGFQVYTHHTVPPGDGGIALGQIQIAANSTRNL